jgi:hypothetical protein
MQRAIRILAGGALLAGCHRPPVASLATTSLAIARAETRAIALEVQGPRELAGPGGSIIGNDGASIVATGGGNLISNDGASIVATGGGNLAAVAGARLRLLSLDGVPLAAEGHTDSAGRAELERGRLDQLAVAVADFAVAGKAYRLAALVPPGAAPAPLRLDPIDTMIEAAAHEAARRHPEAPQFGRESLERIWTLCNRNGLEADADDLELDAAGDKLSDYWHDEVAEKVKDAGDRTELAAFTAALARLAATP